MFELNYQLIIYTYDIRTYIYTHRYEYHIPYVSICCIPTNHHSPMTFGSNLCHRQAAKISQADGFIQQLPKGYDTQIGDGKLLSGGAHGPCGFRYALIVAPRLRIWGSILLI